jgi:hypothetical protein
VRFACPDATAFIQTLHLAHPPAHMPARRSEFLGGSPRSASKRHYTGAFLICGGISMR